MGRFRATIDLKWTEPTAVRRSVARHARSELPRWKRPLFAAVFAGALMLQWALAQGQRNAAPPPFPVAVGVALGGGIAFAYAMPWLLQLCPARIIISERGITYLVGNRVGHLKYDAIDACEIATRHIDGQRVSVLAIHRKAARLITLGIDPGIDLDELTCVLLNRGVAI